MDEFKIVNEALKGTAYSVDRCDGTIFWHDSPAKTPVQIGRSAVSVVAGQVDGQTVIGGQYYIDLMCTSFNGIKMDEMIEHAYTLCEKTGCPVNVRN